MYNQGNISKDWTECIKFQKFIPFHINFADHIYRIIGAFEQVVVEANNKISQYCYNSVPDSTKRSWLQRYYKSSSVDCRDPLGIYIGIQIKKKNYFPFKAFITHAYKYEKEPENFWYFSWLRYKI